MKLMKILSILILFFITSCVYNPQRPDIVESSSAQRVQTVQAAIVVDVKSIIISGDRETGAIAGGVIGAAAMGFLFNLWGANALMHGVFLQLRLYFRCRSQFHSPAVCQGEQSGRLTRVQWPAGFCHHAVEQVLVQPACRRETH